VEGAPGSPLEPAKAPAAPPTLWQIFRKTLAPDTRRGMAFGLEMLNAFGRSTKP